MTRIPSSTRDAFTTLDGSLITEWVHPDRDAARAQSLALAEVGVGESTHCHRHRCSEEIYHVRAGRGEMHLGESVFELGPGDSVVIPPGTEHWIRNCGTDALRFLCCCAPAYSDVDTELVGDTGGAASV